MTMQFRSVGLVAALILFVGAGRGQVPASALKLTANEAKHTIEKMLLAVDRTGRENNAFSNYFKDLEPIQGIEVSMTGFSYIDRGMKDSGFSWKTFSATRSYKYSALQYVSVSKSCPKRKGGGKFWCLSPQITAEGSDPKLTWSSEEQAQQFANALDRLIYESSPEKAAADKKELDGFATLALNWQNAGSKQDVPAQVENLRLLAESYIKENDFDRAVMRYEEGVKIYTTWPVGHFNLALLYGELGSYADAIKHMKQYLMLVPGASDAEAARSKVLFWEDKLRN